MDEVVIREAEPRDLEDLVDLTIAFQLHHEASNPRVWRITEQGRLELRNGILKMLANQEARVLVADSKGEIIAFVSGEIQRRTTYTPSNIGQISRIFVKEEHRRRGIATRLVNQLCHFFESGDVQEVTLNYIIGNKQAEEFWTNLGFQPIRISANQQLEPLARRLRLNM